MTDNKYLKNILVVVTLLLGIYVALSPNVVYAPTPRIILFFSLSVIPAVLFGSELSSKFNLNLPGFAFAVAGAGAVFFGSLFALDHLSKPEEQIAVYTFFDEEGNELQIDAPGLVKLNIAKTGLTVTQLTKGNTLVLIFPEQVPEVEVNVWKFASEKPYRGILTYAGNRKSQLNLGKELTQ